MTDSYEETKHKYCQNIEAIGEIYDRPWEVSHCLTFSLEPFEISRTNAREYLGGNTMHTARVDTVTLYKSRKLRELTVIQWSTSPGNASC